MAPGPVGLPVLPEVRLAARSLVAGADPGAGGDWFDTLVRPDGVLALIVGDVVGHGAGPQPAMTELRAELCELLAAGAELDVIFARADALAARSPALQATTLVAALLDPATGQLRYGTCGHPPPLLVTETDGARFLPVTVAGPLGTGDTAVAASATVQPGELLLAYTDGLVEGPGRSVEDGMAELARAASAERGQSGVRSPEWLCGPVADLLLSAGPGDDVTALAVRRLPEPVAGLRLDVPAEASSLGAVRDALDEWFGALGAAVADRDAVQIACTEVVTNTVEHAYGGQWQGTVGVAVELTRDGRACVRVSDFGQWLDTARDGPERGRGLSMAAGAVDDLHVQPAAVGKIAGTAVTIRHRLHRPVFDAVGAAVPVRAAGSVGPAFGTDTDPGTGQGPPLVRVRGPVDLTTAEAMVGAVFEACRGGAFPITVDLTEVTQLASAGVRGLHLLDRQLRAHRRRLTLYAEVGTPARAVLDLAGLNLAITP